VSASAATSDPRATEAAAEVLRAGGNAIDAAVTAAFVLYVVEPQSCGIGGDGFLFVHDQPGPPVALDGSGAVPVGLTQAALERDGLAQVPARGGRSVTTPGAVSLLADALERHGTITLASAVTPAIGFARNGFDVRDTLARAAALAATSSPSVLDDGVLGPLYWPGGQPVASGVTVVNPALAEALEYIAEVGEVAMRSGALGQAIVDAVRADGGYLTLDDLASHQTELLEPISVEFAEHRMWQLPAPTQGPAVIAALRDIASTGPVDWASVERAMRSAMREAGFDPSTVQVGGASPARGDTTFLATVDATGRGVSMITSVFGDFGSQLGVAALGGPVHNRAATFRLAARPLGPGKPPHTTIPGLVTTAGGDLCALVGVAGGVMQPQAQVQLMIRWLIEGLEPQAAIDAPRFKICFGGDLALEAGHSLAADAPAALTKNPGPEGFGAAQMIAWIDGRLSAGADGRRSGHAVVID